MSDREFENYLTLLGGLLRLDRKQRHAIADELRAHLEDRFEGLVGEGVSKEEAAHRALAEFGDAAGLAGQFVAISRNRRRRWMMRLTTFSVAMTVLIAAGIAIFWPGRNAAPGIAAAVAQNLEPAVPPPSNQPNEQQPPAGRLESELSRRTNIDVINMPLKDVLKYLGEVHNIGFYVKKNALTEESRSEDDPVSITVNGSRLSTVLELMLGELGLTFVEKDNLIVVTTQADAETTMEIRVYDCRDLLSMASPNGHSGPIFPSPPTLTITPVPPEVAPSLNPPTVIPPRRELPQLTPQNPPLIEAPRDPNGNILDLPRTPTTGGLVRPGYLGAVVDDENADGRGVRVLSIRNGGPAQRAGLLPGDVITKVNEKAIRDLDEFDALLANAVSGQTVHFGFTRNNRSMRYHITLGDPPRSPWQDSTGLMPGGTAPGTIIPPPPSRSNSTIPRDVQPQFGGLGGRDPLASSQQSAGGMGGSGRGSARQKQPQSPFEERTDQLIDLVTTTVDPDSWDVVGGPGAIAAYNGLIVVTQTGNTHRKVQHVFDMLRQAAGLEPSPTSKFYR